MFPTQDSKGANMCGKATGAGPNRLAPKRVGDLDLAIAAITQIAQAGEVIRGSQNEQSDNQRGSPQKARGA